MPMNKADVINYTALGVIHSPFTDAKGTPIQPPAARGIAGTVELFPEYVEGLRDLDGFSHVILLYHFDRARPSPLLVKPFLDEKERGVFATRAPSRPNPIGLSIVRLRRVEGSVLHVEDVDVLDGTPLLDIKPYVPEFDERASAATGWIRSRTQHLPEVGDDGRFTL